MKDGRIVEVTEVVGVEGSRVIFERYRPPHDTVLKTVSCGVAMVFLEILAIVEVSSRG